MAWPRVVTLRRRHCWPFWMGERLGMVGVLEGAFTGMSRLRDAVLILGRRVVGFEQWQLDNYIPLSTSEFEAATPFSRMLMATPIIHFKVYSLQAISSPRCPHDTNSHTMRYRSPS